ncbi:MAG: hypothetical protein JNK15_10355 [Planctomycetes bacterium]|nr:hypothetical protein [Planctomycetota bacterium]
MRARIASTFAFGLWFTGTLTSQSIPVDKLRQDLASQKAIDVAWAAYHVRAEKHRQLVVPLQRALGAWRQAAGEESKVVCLHVLDALIALDAKVPAGELVDLVDDATCGTAAFVLLAREPKTNEAELCALFRRDFPVIDLELAKQRDRQTLVLGELLAMQAPPGFADLVAPACAFRLHLEVLAPGESPRTPSIRLHLDRPTVSMPTAEWPLRPVFFHAPPSAQGQEVGSIRIHPKLQRWVQRKDTPPRDRGIVSFELPIVPAHAERPLPVPLGLLRTAADLTERPHTEVTIHWTNDAQYVREATAARDRLQAFVDAMRTKLVAKGALRAEDASKLLPVRIEVEVTDGRTNPAAPLPGLPSPK